MGKRMSGLQLANLVCRGWPHGFAHKPNSGRSNNRILMLIGQINAMHSAESVEADLFVKSGWAPPASVCSRGCPCRKPYPAWLSIENRTIIVCNEGSLQAHWLDGCRSDPVAGNA